MNLLITKKEVVKLSDSTNDIISRLDKLIEQISLTNALLGARLMDYDTLKKTFISFDWQDIETAPERVDDAPEQKKQRLIIQNFYRIAEKPAEIGG